MEYSPRYGRFRALLRKIREEAGLSQYELADKLGKPQSFVSKSEIGERSIDFLQTLDFCAACKVPMARFTERLQKEVPDKMTAAKRKRRSGRKPPRAG
jgi:transcriptional regulator with XRE-family HTH domain